MENLTDFEFYLKFTKPLILHLPLIDDRVLAAAWVKRLRDDKTADEKVKLDYLKLLLFVLQRRKLAPPFTQHPNASETLDKFAANQTLVDVAKTIIETEHAERQEKHRKRLRKGDYPPYISDFSADLLEYVAVQNIEDFGVHGYYAISKEPLGTWYRVDKQLLPKAAKSMLEVSPPPPTLVETHSASEVPEKTAEKPAEARPPVEVPPAEAAEEPPPEAPKESPKKKSPRKSALGATPPSRPIGKVSPPKEDREPPTWGTNLLEAKLLEEDVGDVVKGTSNLDEFFPADESADISMEVLWSSISSGGPSISLEDELPDLIDDEDLDIETSAPSLPYLTPPLPPRAAPVKKLVKKPQPKPRQTRASILLQQKKALEAAPPPPPPKKPGLKKPSRVAKKVSKTKAAAAAEEEPEEKMAVVRKGAAKGKKPGAPRPLVDDDVEQYVTEHNKILADLEAQYQSDLAELETKYQEDLAEGIESKIPGKTKIGPPKRQLSRIAKGSKQKIPKSHAAPVELEKSIHISPEAQRILDDIVEGPSTSTGITQHPASVIKHPQPRVPHVEEEFYDEAEPVEITASGGRIAPGVKRASMATAPGHKGKDPRVVEAFNEMLDTSARIERAEMAANLGGIDLSEMDINVAHVPGENIDALMEQLHPEQRREPDYDDFEAMERIVEQQMREEGLDPHAKPKRKLSKKDFQKGLQDYRRVHARADAQLYGLEEPDYDDFEAMEQLAEAQARAEGQAVGVFPQRSKVPLKARGEGVKRYLEVRAKADAQAQELDLVDHEATVLDAVPAQAPAAVVREPSPKREVAVARKSPLKQVAEEEEEWFGGHEFFEREDEKYLASLPPEERAKFLFPSVDFGEEPKEVEDELGTLSEEFMEVDIRSPQSVNAQLRDIGFIYSDYWYDAPASAGVPVTAPRPSVIPARPKKSPKRDYWKYQYMFPLPAPEGSYLSKVKPLDWIESPPPMKQEFMPIPTSPSQIVSKFPEDYFKYKYESPERVVHPMKPVQKIDLSGMSPPSRTWWSDMNELHKKIHGIVTPEKTQPDVFDLPAERIYAESPPAKLASPVSPLLSPPIDKEALKSKIYAEYLKPPPEPYKRRIAPGIRVQRYTHGTPMQRREVIQESEDEAPAYLTTEDQLLKDRLKEFQAVKERRPIRVGGREIQRRSAAPGLAPVKEMFESPEKKYPDVFDLPDMHDVMWAESPPKGWASPVSPQLSPQIDPESLRRQIQAEARAPHKDIRTRGRAPQLGWYLSERLEEADEDEWGDLSRVIAAQKGMPQKKFPRIQRMPGLPIIGSPVEYPESPTTRRPAPESPDGRQGPQRRTIRKQLKKRRLDFSQPPTSPSESEVQVTDVQTQIAEEREIRTPPSRRVVPDDLERIAWARSMYASPPGETEGSPRTPRLPVIGEEELPEVGPLPEFWPASPMSEYGVLEGVMEEVKQHVPVKPRKKRKKLTEFYKRYPWRQLEQVPEVPTEEAAARIHEEVEAEVEAQIAKEAEEEERKRRTLYDAPVPGHLPPPIEPKWHVPFYSSPPHLKLEPITRRPDMSRRGVKGLFYQRPTSPPPTEEEELDEFERLEWEIESQAGPSSRTRVPEGVPAARPEDIARRQYYSLLRGASPQRRTRPPPAAKTVEELMADIAAMPPSPGMVKQLEEMKAAEEAKRKAEALDFEYQQSVKEKKGKGKGKPKGKGKYAHVKSKALDAVKSDKSVASKRSDKSIKSAKSATSARSKASDTGLVKPLKRKKFNVVSKIDTGTRQKKRIEKEVAAEKPVVEVKYDLADLHDLGLTAADLQQLNLDDANVIELEAEPPGGALTDTEETFNEIDEEFSPLELEQAPELFEEVFELPEGEGPPIRRRVPIGQEPVSPSKLRSELEAHTMYDPHSRRKTKKIKIKGRNVPLQGPRKPGLATFVEEDDEMAEPQYAPPTSPVKKRRRVLPTLQQSLAQAAASPQYMSPRPVQPKSPRRMMPAGALDEMDAPWMADTHVFDVVSADDYLDPHEQTAVMEVEILSPKGPGSPGAYDYSWGGTSPVPKHLAGFKWMRPSVKKDKWPWEED